MPAYCSNCGGKLAEDSKYCGSCGSPREAVAQVAAPAQPQFAQAQPQPLSPQRTESIVVQVAPEYEQLKITEMEQFGWNLLGRQEIHERGNAYGRPSFLDSSSYVITTEVSRYVKLHFIRSLAIPNLEYIKKIEAEYSSLPFPPPAKFKGPGCLAAFGLFSVVLLIPSAGRETSAFVTGLVIAAIGILWIVSRVNQSQKAALIREQSLKRMGELRAMLTA